MQDADIFYSGAENMMTDFVSEFGAQIDESTIDPLYVRVATILVHPGNPLKIRRFIDLTRSGVRVMVVQGSGQSGLWEDIAGRFGDVGTNRALRRNIVAFEPDTATAHQVWNSPGAPDVWIALYSEHGAHPTASDAIQLEPGLEIVRDAGIALTMAGETKLSAKRFYNFVRSADGLAIFKRWGWCSRCFPQRGATSNEPAPNRELALVALEIETNHEVSTTPSVNPIFDVGLAGQHSKGNAR